MSRPLEKRFDYVLDLQRIKRFREAFAIDERHVAIRKPVLSAVDIVLSMMMLDHDPVAAWSAADASIRALVEEYSRRQALQTNGSK